MALPLSAGGPGSWTTAGSLNTARANHAAAMLPNGQALIVGGIGELGRSRSTSAEIFNLYQQPSPTLPAGLPAGVSGLTATVLNDNTVLLAGGLNSAGKAVSAAELYDPTPERVHQAAGDEKGAQPSYCDTAARRQRADRGRQLTAAATIANLEIFDPASENIHGGGAS